MSTISIVLSTFIIYPTFSVFLAVLNTCKLRFQKSKLVSSNNVDLGKDQSDALPKGKRFFLFNYLQPPLESELIPKAEFSLKRKYTFTYLSCCFVGISIFILLSLMTYPTNINLNYLQRQSIKNIFSRSIGFHSRSEGLWQILYDTTDLLYEETCDDSHDCSLVEATGCYHLGPVYLKRSSLEVKTCERSRNYPSFHQCSLLTRHVVKKQRNVTWFYDYYPIRNSPLKYLSDDVRSSDVVLLNVSRSDANRTLSDLEVIDWLDDSTKDITIEFLLFNPTYSLFSSVSVKIKVDDSLSKAYTIVDSDQASMQQLSVYQYVLHFSCEILFALVVCFLTKKTVWKALKERKLFWFKLENYLKVLFIMVSFAYIVCSTLYQIKMKETLLELKNVLKIQPLDIIWLSLLEMTSRNILSFLLFLHQFEILQLSKFSFFLNAHLYQFFGCRCELFFCGFVGIFLILDIGYLSHALNLPGSVSSTDHPMLLISRIISLLLKDVRKPEVKNYSDIAETVVFGLYQGMVIIIFFLFISMVRSVLMQSRKRVSKDRSQKIPLKDIGGAVKSKLKKHFTIQEDEETFSVREECGFSADLMLIGLEILSDKLLRKVNRMYVKQTAEVESHRTVRSEENTLSDGDKYFSSISSVSGSLKDISFYGSSCDSSLHQEHYWKESSCKNLSPEDLNVSLEFETEAATNKKILNFNSLVSSYSDNYISCYLNVISAVPVRNKVRTIKTRSRIRSCEFVSKHL